MKKDAYYFSHDANAQDDHKCIRLIDVLGMEGYGIFWALVEKLRSENEYRLPLDCTGGLAKRWGTSKEKVDAVIFNFNLFLIENSMFFSQRLLRSMETYKEKSEKGRKFAEKRWGTHSLPNANPMGTHSLPNANPMQLKEIKEKEIKEKEIKEKEVKKAFTPPTIEEVTAYTNERGTGIDPNRFFDFYQSKGWRVGAQAMKDWRAAVRTWERRDSGWGANNGGDGGIKLSRKGQDTLRIMQNVDAYLEGVKNANA